MLLCGVDEAGRGALVYSVFAAAVILPDSFVAEGLKDSKKMTEKSRLRCYDLIVEQAISWSVASATAAEIDRLNILQATKLAMKRAILGLRVKPDMVKIDGRDKLDLVQPCEAVIGGDDLYLEISAASVLAKVSRDQEMVKLAEQFPEYGFEKHKGYGTKQHLQALARFGATKYHRLSFKPVKYCLVV